VADKLQIEIYKDGDHYSAACFAETPVGKWGGRGPRGTSPVEAASNALDEIWRVARRMGPGRKPRGYRAAIYLTGGQP